MTIELEHKLEHLLTRLEIMKVRHMLEFNQISSWGSSQWGKQVVGHQAEERKQLTDEITQIKMELKHDS